MYAETAVCYFHRFGWELSSDQHPTGHPQTYGWGLRRNGPNSDGMFFESLSEMWRWWKVSCGYPQPWTMMSGMYGRNRCTGAWPDANPLGKRLWFAGHPVRVVGVVEALVAPSLRNVASSQMSVIAPVRRVASDLYALRVDAKMCDQVLSGLPRLLSSLNRGVVISSISSFEAAQDAYFHDDKELIWLLLFVTGVLLTITVLGIAGLSSFWVFKRTRSIGIRRAWAPPAPISFAISLARNLAVTACGVLLGAGAAIGVNFWLMANYEVPKLITYTCCSDRCCC